MGSTLYVAYGLTRYNTVATRGILSRYVDLMFITSACADTAVRQVSGTAPLADGLCRSRLDSSALCIGTIAALTLDLLA